MIIGDINPLVGAINPVVQELSATQKAAKPNSFESFYNAYLNVVEETSASQFRADQIQLDFAAGRTDDMLAVVLAQEEAYASLNFTVQVTNKLIDAYREIMRMQI